MGFIPLRFIVAPLLPRLPRSVDGEIRAKNFRGNGSAKARQKQPGFLIWNHAALLLAF